MQTPDEDENLIRRIDAERTGRIRPLPPGVTMTPDESATRAEWARQDASIRRLYGEPLHEPLPDRFADMIGLSVGETEAGRQPRLNPSDVATPRGRPGRLAVMAACLALGIAIGFGAARTGTPSEEGPDLAEAAALAHRTYAGEVTHPVEVPAGETSLPAWLSRRVGIAITPPDLTAEGFSLVGGRVLPGSNGSAAAMLYEDDKGERVTVYVAPTPGAPESGLRYASDEAAPGYWWTDHGFGCAVVGEAPRETLKVMATKAYKVLGG